MAEFEFVIDGVTERVSVEPHEDGFLVTIGDRVHHVEGRRMGDHRLSLLIGNRSVEAHVVRDGDSRLIALDGRNYRVSPPTDEAGGDGAAGAVGDGTIRTPMPGKVVKVQTSVGAEVQEGDTLVIVEAMKMEHELRAPFAGKVSAVNCEDGATVQFDDVLIEVQPAAE